MHRAASAGELPLRPEDVVVVINADDPDSRAIADHYKATWGVTREVTVRLGNAHDVSTSKATTARNAVSGLNAKALALCFTKPSRVAGNNSITSVMAHGYSTSWSATGPAYGKPAANVPRAVLVNDVRVINRARAATGTKPAGTIYVLLANDGGGTAPRGDMRAGQVTTTAANALRAKLPATVKLEVIDNRKGCAGNCPGNYLQGRSDVLAFFGSMYGLAGWETNTVLPGAYADHVTSHSGILPDGYDQFPITQFTATATHSSGTVVEPWMSNSVTTARQFARVDSFSVAYFAQGRSFAEAIYRAVERPWRLLIIGDPLCAPYADVQPVLPPPIDEQPQPEQPTTPQPGEVKALYEFLSGTTANITATIGDPLVQSTSWQRFTSIGGGKLTNANSLAHYPVSWTGTSEVTITGLTWTGTPNYQMIMGTAQGRGLVVLPDGSIVRNDSETPVAPKGSVLAGKMVNLTISLDPPMDITWFGCSPNQANAWQGSIQELRIR
jgi:uncharacterized protein (TIGR03790 family)